MNEDLMWEQLNSIDPLPYVAVPMRTNVADEYLVATGESTKYDFIVDYFVDIITSPYDQDVSLLLVGNKGGGKSRAGLSLCYYAACEVAERKGGRWDDYFNPLTHMAIISPKRASELMAVKDKYAIKNYDDIGIGWGARNWQQKENIEKGEVFQISRIDNQLQIFSVPNQFLLDKIPRSLVSHYAEMDGRFYAHGFTTMKLFRPSTLFREGKIIQPYLSVNRVKYVLYRIPKPPAFLDKLYTTLRKEATTEAMHSRLTSKEAIARSEKRGLTSSIKLKPREAIAQHRAVIESMMAAGTTRSAITAYLRNTIGYSNGKVRYWWDSGVFTSMGLDPEHGAPMS